MIRLVPALPPPAAPGRVMPVVALACWVALAGSPAGAGCLIDLTVRNESSHRVGFVIGNVQVRANHVIYRLPWTSAHSQGWMGRSSTATVIRLEPYSHRNDDQVRSSFLAQFSCDHYGREVRVADQCLTGIYAATNFLFSASDSSWSSNQRVDIGGACR